MIDQLGIYARQEDMMCTDPFEAIANVSVLNFLRSMPWWGIPPMNAFECFDIAIAKLQSSEEGLIGHL